jgi:hypothetical protein
MNKKEINDPRINDTLAVLEDILLENDVGKNVFKYVSDLRDKFITANIKVDRCSVVKFFSGEEKVDLTEEFRQVMITLKVKGFSWKRVYTSKTTTLKNYIGQISLEPIDANLINLNNSKFVLKESPYTNNYISEKDYYVYLK